MGPRKQPVVTRLVDVDLFFSWGFFFAVSNIFDVKLNSSEAVKALRGQRLVLNCSSTAELNSRANISWDYPGKVRTRRLLDLVNCSRVPPIIHLPVHQFTFIFNGTAGIRTQHNSHPLSRSTQRLDGNQSISSLPM